LHRPTQKTARLSLRRRLGEQADEQLDALAPILYTY
jgi:hypothetical protein